VHNLAYKLAALHQNWGGPFLLQTYQAERRQVALVASQQSVKNGKQIFGLLKAIGTTDSNLDTAKRNLYQRIKDPVTRTKIMKGIEAQREHFDNLGLHIGYVYGDTEIPASASLYKPSYRAGARLPHAWLIGIHVHYEFSHLPHELPRINNGYISEQSRLGVLEKGRKTFSTLDICAFDAFTFIFSDDFSEHWSQVLEILKAQVPLRLKINAALLGKDFYLIDGKRSEEWVMGFQFDRGGAVLVRPDQHILDCYGIDAGVEEVSKGLLEHLGL
jgi:hypothetical protein